MQEAQHREDLIENKLLTLKQILENTQVKRNLTELIGMCYLLFTLQEVAQNSWKAMIDEDRLLQRLENLEGQLMTYVKVIIFQIKSV